MIWFGLATRTILDLALVAVLFYPYEMGLNLLRAESIGSELALTWDDRRESFIPWDVLRRHCPCARCQGEGDLLTPASKPLSQYGPMSFLLRSFRFVGGYALQPAWADGHDSGLYAFPLLRKIGEQVMP